MATIKDVAREAGVALSTVSKYLNGGNVREENREKIEEAVKKLNFKVNFHAHAMRSGCSKMVLVMVPQFEDRYCCEIMQTARSVLLEQGYVAVLAESRGDPRKEQEILQRAINRQVDGIIALNTDLSSALYDELRQNNIPLVVIGKAYGRKHSGCVYFDDAEKFTKLFRQLKANGHSRIGIIGGGIDKARLHSREFSYYLGLFAKAGLIIDDSYIFADDCGTVDIGMKAVKYFSEMEQPPTAIVCLNSLLLLGVNIQLHLMGLRVPEDISACVLARMSEKDSVHLKHFAAVYQPVEEATERAVNLLLENISSISEGRSQSQTVVKMNTLLNIGESIAAANEYTFLRPDEQQRGGES